MTVTLTPDLEKLVNEKVQRGEYESPEALIQEAVQRLFTEDEQELSEMKVAVDLALEQSKRGEGRAAQEVFKDLRARYDIPR